MVNSFTNSKSVSIYLHSSLSHDSTPVIRRSVIKLQKNMIDEKFIGRWRTLKAKWLSVHCKGIGVTRNWETVTVSSKRLYFSTDFPVFARLRRLIRQQDRGKSESENIYSRAGRLALMRKVSRAHQRNFGSL